MSKVETIEFKSPQEFLHKVGYCNSEIRVLTNKIFKRIDLYGIRRILELYSKEPVKHVAYYQSKRFYEDEVKYENEF